MAKKKKAKRKVKRKAPKKKPTKRYIRRRKNIKKKAKKVQGHAKKLHAIGKKYVEHTLKTVELHKDKRKKAAIKKKLKAMEKALRDLIRLESR